MAVIKWEVSAATTLITTGMNSLADEGNAISSEINNTSNLYLFDDVELYTNTLGYTPAAGSVVELYLVVALDGTNYEDGDGSIDRTSSRSGVEAAGRFNPSNTVSLDARARYNILFDRISDVSLLGFLRRDVVRTGFSPVHRNALGPGAADSTQIRLLTGVTLCKDRFVLVCAVRRWRAAWQAREGP